MREIGRMRNGGFAYGKTEKKYCVNGKSAGVSIAQMKFGQMKQDSLPRQCKECEFLFACNGECPKNRFSRTADGEPGLNYLCKGYHQFFQHVAPYMDYMKKELLAERAPANIMEAIKKGEL